MKIKFYILSIFIFSLMFHSCDEEESQSQSLPARDRTEQQSSDLDSLHNYLSTHFFNSGYINEMALAEPVVVGIKLLIADLLLLRSL